MMIDAVIEYIYSKEQKLKSGLHLSQDYTKSWG